MIERSTGGVCRALTGSRRRVKDLVTVYDVTLISEEITYRGYPPRFTKIDNGQPGIEWPSTRERIDALYLEGG